MEKNIKASIRCFYQRVDWNLQREINYSWTKTYLVTSDFLEDNVHSTIQNGRNAVSDFTAKFVNYFISIASYFHTVWLKMYDT